MSHLFVGYRVIDFMVKQFEYINDSIAIHMSCGLNTKILKLQNVARYWFLHIK